MVKIFYTLKVCVLLAVIGCCFGGLCSIVTIYMFIYISVSARLRILPHATPRFSTV
jgi:hypothetical protein